MNKILKIKQPKLNFDCFIPEEIKKAYTEGVYSDSPANRKLGRVGMSYKDYANKTHQNNDEKKNEDNDKKDDNNKKKDWTKDYIPKLKQLIKESVGQLDGSDKEPTEKQINDILHDVLDFTSITKENGTFNVEANTRAFYRSAQDHDLDFGYGGAENIGPELEKYLNKNFGKKKREAEKKKEDEVKKNRLNEEEKKKNELKKESSIYKEKFDKNIIGEVDIPSTNKEGLFPKLRKNPLLKDCSDKFVRKLSEAIKGENGDRIIKLKSSSREPLFAIISGFREKNYADDASKGYAMILTSSEDPDDAWRVSNRGSDGYKEIYKDYKEKLSGGGKRYNLLH